jgi:predicted NBD/HSP70 family sugar kinase
MENDADAAALGEAGWGAGRKKERLVYVTIGTGIGSGIISVAGCIGAWTRRSPKSAIT